LLEHNYLADLVNKNNSLMNIALFIVYFNVAAIADVTIYMTIFVINSLYLRITFMVLAAAYAFFLFHCTYSSACLFKSAHSLHAPLSSLIAKCANLRTRRKMMVSFYIGRLTGPPITTWVYNLFGLTNYEFYVFISVCVNNFFLVMDIFKNK